MHFSIHRPLRSHGLLLVLAVLAGLWLALVSTAAGAAEDAKPAAEPAPAGDAEQVVKEPAAEEKEESKRPPCSRCGVIEAINSRIVPAGVNGYYVYDLHIRMEKTGLLKVVPVPTRATFDVGDRVRIMGGNVTPEPRTTPERK